MSIDVGVDITCGKCGKAMFEEEVLCNKCTIGAKEDMDLLETLDNLIYWSRCRKVEDPDLRELIAEIEEYRRAS